MAGLALLLSAVACGGSSPPSEEEQTLNVLGAPGEWTNGDTTQAPRGSALEARNVVVTKAATYTTHPGLEAMPTGAGQVDSFTVWNGSPVVHRTDSTLAYYDGSWHAMPGTYAAPSGAPVEWWVAKQSLFFTTEAGVYRIDSLATGPVLAGLPPALSSSASPTGSSGFLADGDTTAYRHVWALKNEHDRLLSGPPSPRVVVSNAAGASRNVAHTVPIPAGLPTGAVLQSYRADAVDTATVGGPTDEMAQVYEREPTAAERTAGAMAFTDSRPDEVKGFGAYFNPNTGDGLTAAKYRPPVSKHVVQYDHVTVYMAVDGLQRLSVALLGVGAPQGLQSGQGIVTKRGTVAQAYYAGASESFPSTFKLFTDGTPAQNLAQTVDSLVRCINSDPNGIVYGYTANDDGLSFGKFRLEARILNSDPITVDSVGGANAFTPALHAYVASGTIARTGGSTVTVTTMTPHGFVPGESVRLYDIDTGGPSTTDPNFPFGAKTIVATPTATTFTYSESGSNVTGTAGVYLFESTSLHQTTTSGTAKNAVAWSEYDAPDSVPLGNYLEVGDADKAVLWGQVIGSTLFIGKEDGLFRATYSGGVLTAKMMDNTAFFVGSRNHVLAKGGTAYALTTGGLAQWTEASAKTQPAFLETNDQVLALTTPAMAATTASAGFMVNDDANNRVYLFVPQQPGDTSASKAHVYNLLANAKTRLVDDFPGLDGGVVAGLAPVEEGRLYLAPAATNQEGLLRTRNTGTVADYQGPAGEGIPTFVAYAPLTLGRDFTLWTLTQTFLGDPVPSSIAMTFATDVDPTPTRGVIDHNTDFAGWSPTTAPVQSTAVNWIVDAGDHSHRTARNMFVTVEGSGLPQEPLNLFGFTIEAEPPDGQPQ